VLIPRIFHQIWVGPDPFPEDFLPYQETWLAHNPGWELRLWTEENLPGDLERTEAYERLRQPAERADILRLELLYRQGGVYVDVDFECLRPIEPLIESVDIFVARPKRRRLNNAIMGAVPGHPLLARAVREIEPRSTFGPVDKARTGPLFLRTLVRDYSEVAIFEPDLFYPRTPEAREHGYGMHHQAGTWKDADKLRKQLLGAQRRLREAQDEAHQWRARFERAEAEIARLKLGSSSVVRLRQLFARK
jgi:mannosyltransferase OCH1-like enzyme